MTGRELEVGRQEQQRGKSGCELILKSKAQLLLPESSPSPEPLYILSVTTFPRSFAPTHLPTLWASRPACSMLLGNRCALGGMVTPHDGDSSQGMQQHLPAVRFGRGPLSNF